MATGERQRPRLETVRRFWSALIDALERHLDRRDQSLKRATPTKENDDKEKK
jgi:hypothetical protein